MAMSIDQNDLSLNDSKPMSALHEERNNEI